MAKNKLDYAGMQKRIAATSGAPSGTPVYSRAPRTASYQDRRILNPKVHLRSM